MKTRILNYLLKPSALLFTYVLFLCNKTYALSTQTPKMHLNTALFSSSTVSVQSLPQVSTDSSEIKIILSILFAVLGAIALLVITLAGFRYIISRGEPQEIARAKNTIIYALIGLVVAILAFTIVNFVVGQF